MPGSRKLGRPTDQRRAMLRGLVTHLLQNGKIETTVTRAKEVQPMVERMIPRLKLMTSHQRDMFSLMLLRKMLLKNFLTRLLLSIQIKTVVTLVLLKQALVAATALKCVSLSFYN